MKPPYKNLKNMPKCKLDIESKFIIEVGDNCSSKLIISPKDKLKKQIKYHDFVLLTFT